MSLAVRPNHHTSGGWRRIPIAVPKQDPAKTSLVEAGAYIVAILVFWAAVLRIDFHADEAIYLSSIPVGIGNDAGLVYHLIYLLGSWGTPTPVAGRMTSLVLGVLLIVFVTRSFQCWFPQRRALVSWLVPVLIAVSYQGIFLTLRVRPEISWVLVSAMTVCFLSYAESTKRRVFMVLALAALLLLPMNHRLAWFPCAFLAVYLLLFASRSLGWRFTIAGLSAMGLGTILNVVLRAWLAGADVHEAVAVFCQSTSSAHRPDLDDFFVNVYWTACDFLRDGAAAASWWDRTLPRGLSRKVSHFFFQCALWAACLPLPLVAKTWRTRYVFAFPLFAFVAFHVSGYYNPTYATIFSLYSVLAVLYVSLDEGGWRRGVASALVCLSLFNGLSFLATRVLNHGYASIYCVEQEIRDLITRLEPGESIAYPERLMSAGLFHPGPKAVLFKNPIPKDVDLIIVDDYDFDMYRFVPDYEERRKEIEAVVAERREVRSYTEPVYENEKMLAGSGDPRGSTVQGSWFFRNAVGYRVTVWQRQEKGPWR